MPDTPSTRWAIERPADGDLIHDWPSIMRTSIDSIDAVLLGWNSTDPRPAAGTAGRIHRHPTTGVLSFDTGTGWATMTQTPHAADHVEGGPDPIKGQVPIGGLIPYAGSALPPGSEWDWADGGLIDRTTYATFFARVGHAYNGGVDPGGNLVRKPDKRGRVPMGADSFGPLGAANRVPTETAAGRGLRGQNGGAERVQLASGESGIPAHSHAPGGSHSHGAGSGTALSGIFPLEYPAFTDSWDNSAMPSISAGGSGVANPPVPMVSGSMNHQPWNGGPDLNHAHSVTVSPANDANTANNTAAGAASSHQNLQPYEADNYIVRIA